MALIQGTTAVPKSVAKLIDTIGDQIGLFLEPTHIRRKGQAEADVMVAQAKAKGLVAVLGLQNKLALQDIQDRAEERVKRQEAKRQKNLEAIAAQAARELPGTVSDQPVDEDWIAQFFNHCQDVSNEQMQTIWARILAREVTKPGSFSLRALALVRVMDKDDANTFTRFCSVVWRFPGGPNPIIPDFHNLSSLPGIQLSFGDLIRLDSLGLIRFDANQMFEIRMIPPRFTCLYHGREHTFSRPPTQQQQPSSSVPIGPALLTAPGEELAAISGSSPNEQYRASVLTFVGQWGWGVEETPSSPAK
jgi:hypothetical protein